MGLPSQAPTPPDVFAHQIVTSLYAFPSPASVTGSLNSPTFRYTPGEDSLSLAQLSLQDGLLGAADVVPTEPGDIKIQPIMTPPANEEPESTMETTVGGALAPVHLSAPRQAPATRGHGLRLPSFETLGIAAPHPDRYGGFGLDGTLANAAREAMYEPLSAPHTDSNLAPAFDAVHIGHPREELSDPLRSKPLERGVQSPIRRYVDPLTPPADIGPIDWSPAAMAMTAPTNSSATDPGHTAPPAHEAHASADPAGMGSIRRHAGGRPDCCRRLAIVDCRSSRGAV